MPVFVKLVLILALVLLAVDGYLLYTYYPPDSASSRSSNTAAAGMDDDLVASRTSRDGYLDEIEEIQAESVDAFLNSNDALLRYDSLKADDLKNLRDNRDALADYRARAGELTPPEGYGKQHQAFIFALSDLHYAADTAYRLAADPLSADQSDFDAYELHADRAEDYLRRSNDLLGRNYATIEDAPRPTSGTN